MGVPWGAESLGVAGQVPTPADTLYMPCPVLWVGSWRRHCWSPALEARLAGSSSVCLVRPGATFCILLIRHG